MAWLRPQPLVSSSPKKFFSGLVQPERTIDGLPFNKWSKIHDHSESFMSLITCRFCSQRRVWISLDSTITAASRVDGPADDQTCTGRPHLSELRRRIGLGLCAASQWGKIEEIRSIGPEIRTSVQWKKHLDCCRNKNHQASKMTFSHWQRGNM